MAGLSFGLWARSTGPSPAPRAQLLVTSERTSVILTAPVAGFVFGQMRQRRLHRHQPVQHVRVVVLEADVQDVGLPGRGDVAGHLERHRRLAGALGATDEHQLARPQAPAEHLVERRHAERDRLVVGQLARGDLLAHVVQNVECGSRRHRTMARLEEPAVVRGRRLGGPGSGSLAAPCHAVVPPIRASSGDIVDRSSHSRVIVRSPAS